MQVRNYHTTVMGPGNFCIWRAFSPPRVEKPQILLPTYLARGHTVLGFPQEGLFARKKRCWLLNHDPSGPKFNTVVVPTTQFILAQATSYAPQSYEQRDVAGSDTHAPVWARSKRARVFFSVQPTLHRTTDELITSLFIRNPARMRLSTWPGFEGSPPPPSRGQQTLKMARGLCFVVEH